MVKRVMFTSLPTNDLGLITRLLPVAQELMQRGVHVLFSHPANAARKLLQDKGFENDPPRHPIYEVGYYNFSLSKLFSHDYKMRYGGFSRFLLDLAKSVPYKKLTSTTEVWDADHAFALTGFMNYHFINAQVKANIDLMQRQKIDVVVDAWNPAACIAAKYLKLPLVTINQGDALPAARGFIWWKEKPAGIPSVVPVFNRILAYYGLHGISKVEELNLGDLNLVTGMHETDPLDANNSGVYVGSLIDQWSPTIIPRELESLWSDPSPLIWLYAGNLNYGGSSSIFDSVSVLEACVDALSKLSVKVVFTKGYHRLPKHLEKLLANFFCYDFVQGKALAAISDVLIHHGGYGSCQQSLLAGKPSLIMPTFSERESNARRMVKLGVAEMILPTFGKGNKMSFSSEQIQEKIKLLLEKPAYTHRSRIAGKQLRSHGGVKGTVDLIEKFIGTR